MASQSRKVLVVDDEADLAGVLAYALDSAGFDVTVASNASSALSSAERLAPDIILLDVMLPDVDGFTLLPQLRNITRSPVIFLSARARRGDRQRGIQLGASDYVTKPFDLEDLVARMRAALKG
jgi:two-component system, OmpR family, response regulator